MRKIHPSKGFTLIELMIAVAIIGILAAVVVPSYTDYVRRSSLQEGFAALADQKIKLEQFYQSNRSYGTVGAGTPCGNDGSTAHVSFASSANFSYSCTLPGDDDQQFLLTATGTGSAAGHVFTLNHDNVRATTVFKGAASVKQCWLVKGSEC